MQPFTEEAAGQGDSSSELPQWNVMIEKGRNRLHNYVVFENAVGQDDCL